MRFIIITTLRGYATRLQRQGNFLQVNTLSRQFVLRMIHLHFVNSKIEYIQSSPVPEQSKF